MTQILNLIAGATLWNVVLSSVAVAAGSRVALRAWRKLLHRQIAIELLVTVAVAGALLLGEFWEAAAVAVLFVLGERVGPAHYGIPGRRSPVL